MKNKLNRPLPTGLLSAVCSLMLAGSISLGRAQNTNPTNTFDIASSTTSFVQWWGGGGASATMTWDDTRDAANDPASGSVRYDANFVGAAGEQFMTFFTIANRWGWDFGTILDATTYTNMSFDIKVDPISAITPGGNYGNLEVGLTTGTGPGTIYLATYTIPLSATNWTHVDRLVEPTLANIDQVSGFFFKLWSDGAHTNTLAFNLDNVELTQPTVPVVIPPPTMEMTKAGPAGVLITMDDNSSQWQRDAISTPANSGPYLWASQGSYPVSYSCTITNFPAIASHLGFEAHMYVANETTAPANSATSGSPDWGVPDIFIFRVENHATEVYATNGATITTNFTYDARAQIQWKTNYPNANATNIPVIVDAASALGTWTVTFTDSTSGTLTGPGITATNFTLPADAVLNNFSPEASFLQFGIFKNDSANDGHNQQAHGTFSHATFTGMAAPIDDDFSGATLTNKYAWRKTSASAVQFIPANTAWMVDWTLPAADFNPQFAAAVAGPWSNAAFSSTFTTGNRVYSTVSAAALPAGNSVFYRLIKRPFVKLQVLMPGETAAPNTPSGKAGTPDAQTAGLPFNVTVNAVDEFWNRVKSADMVTLTSSDEAATLPAETALISGTATLSVVLNNIGSFTVTATDSTDGTKAPNTGTATTVNQ